MKYDNFINALNEIPSIITLDKYLLSKLNGESRSLFKKSNHKNLVIDIYTCWENYTKLLLFHCYENYKKVIVDKDFLLAYFQRINEKSYTKKLFSESIEENKITINQENLCYSNNLNWNEMLDLFNRLGFNKEDFIKHLNNNIKLEEAINDLKEYVQPISEDRAHISSNLELTKSYLNMVVDFRNSVAHQYEINEILNLSQLDKIYKFIKTLSEIVFEYCVSQIIKKSESKSISIIEKLLPISIIRGNSSGTTAIIAIKNTSLNKYTKDSMFFCYDTTSQIYRILKIKEIRYLDKKNDYIEHDKEYSIEVETHSKLSNKNHNFVICSINERCEDFMYSIVI